MANRKAAEAFILKYIEKLMPGSPNTQLYKDRFAAMSDKEFDQFMKGLEDGSGQLTMIAPNLSDNKLNVQNNLNIAKELGHEFFERIWMKDGPNSPAYLTPQKYLIVDLPLKRQAQLLVKKISIPEDNKSIDDLTGQPTGKSKGSKISYPEIQVLSALGLDQSLTELLKYRGGDVKGFDAMNKFISQQGGVSMQSVEPYSGGVVSTATLKTFLTGMHLQTTI